MDSNLPTLEDTDDEVPLAGALALRYNKHSVPASSKKCCSAEVTIDWRVKGKNDSPRCISSVTGTSSGWSTRAIFTGSKESHKLSKHTPSSITYALLDVSTVGVKQVNLSTAAKVYMSISFTTEYSMISPKILSTCAGSLSTVATAEAIVAGEGVAIGVVFLPAPVTRMLLVCFALMVASSRAARSCFSFVYSLVIVTMRFTRLFTRSVTPGDCILILSVKATNATSSYESVELVCCRSRMLLSPYIRVLSGV
mmetsp:Transcript_10338/g.21183  ORF Transcript_10338/g.21183 Transcript_10338/m.21183 type:complete len:253 (-) Transcript_10338:1428-2186(-)